MKDILDEIEGISLTLAEEMLFLPQTVDYLDMDKRYNQMMFIYEAAVSQMTARLEILNKEFQFGNDRNPIESIKSRIKSKESILQKMSKKGLPMTVSAMAGNILDIAGIRVVCPFIADVYQVAKMILRQKDVEMLVVKDYIREPKENGYRSLHLIVQVEVPFAEHTREVPVEIQIRTIAMNFWASTEHQLRYKKNREFTKGDAEKLKHCADIMAEADMQMQQIAGEFNSDQW